jgi:DeoR family fructose operon transcriptional repressor
LSHNLIFVNLSSERRQRIHEIVNQKRSISVDDLARYFPVSTITIRRDLDRLAEENLLRRVHGGAMALSNIVIAPKAAELSANITEEQKRIGLIYSSKFEKTSFIKVSSAEIFDEIITGTDLNRDIINAYTDAGIKLTPV